MYRVVTYPEASDQIAELPPQLLLDSLVLEREREVHVLRVLWLELPDD